jgi:hypothetical protein
MREFHTFIVTLVTEDDQPAELRGRVRHVAAELATSFESSHQLLTALHALLARNRASHPASPPPASPDEGTDAPANGGDP